MRDKRDLFEILLDQLQIGDSHVMDQLTPVRLDHVDVISQENTWHFYLEADQRLHPEIYQIFTAHLYDAFKDIARTEVTWNFLKDDLSDEDRQTYWFAVYSTLAHEKPLIKAALALSLIHI